ncbi:hypothetical protein EV702DRAFT_1193802 [Suillus placidus]|uniref:Uncharacterized protein n=1 Tax=Suillus placidus TaxID=48579 RepID=A0A9P7A237_9AGAM|nr:hypothetical protein EV702DRAFT_1193802 [Suillus placidus]
MPSTSTINMLEDNILIEIDGVGSMWDTYRLGLNVVTPGFKSFFRFRNIDRAIQMEETTVKCEEVDSVKIEKDDQADIPLDEDSVTVAPCNLLTRRCNNPNAKPTNPYAPWRYSVRPFDRSDIAAKRKVLHQDIIDYAYKHRKF